MNRQLRRTQERRSDPLQPYRDNVAAAPRDAKARNELGCALVATGRLSEAAEQFTGALRLMPELLEQYAQIVGTVVPRCLPLI
jgi:thioredoxin-like negative regulator of GroEL